MRRIVSTTALSGWLGFAIVSVILSSMPLLGGISASGGVTSEATAGVAVLLSIVAAIGLILAALYHLHAPLHPHDTSGAAERLGALGFLAIGLVASFAPMMGVDPFGAEEASIGFWALLLASVAALWFDRAVAPDPETEDDADFEAAVSVIAQSMARQTFLYTNPPERRPDRTM